MNTKNEKSQRFADRWLSETRTEETDEMKTNNQDPKLQPTEENLNFSSEPAETALNPKETPVNQKEPAVNPKEIAVNLLTNTLKSLTIEPSAEEFLPGVITREDFDSDEEKKAHDLQQKRAEEYHARLKFPFDCSKGFKKSRDFAKGYNVIPASPITKTPVGTGFKELTGDQTRFLTVSELVRLDDLVAHDNLNGALLLDSPVPGNSLAVLDIDDPFDMTLVCLWLVSWGINPFEAMAVSTGRDGGGFHLYLRREVDPSVPGFYGQRNGAKIFSRNNIVARDANRLTRINPETNLAYWRTASAVDFKGTRCYTISPYATHRTGRLYLPRYNGEVPGTLEEVTRLLPVLPIEAWKELENPMTAKRWGLIEKAFGRSLPESLTAHYNYEAALANPTKPVLPMVPEGRALPAEVEIVGAETGVLSARSSKGARKWPTRTLSTEHPGYQVFADLLDKSYHPDVVTYGADFVMTRLFVTSTGTGEGARASGGRKVYRTASGILTVTDFVNHLNYEFRTAFEILGGFRAEPEANRDSKAYFDGIGWKGAVSEVKLPNGYLSPDALTNVPSRVIVLKATQGSGKTTLLRQQVDGYKVAGQNVVVVVPTRSLAEQAAPLFVLPHYEDTRGKITGSVVVTGVSLRRVDLEQKDLFEPDSQVSEDGVLILDEIEQILKQCNEMGTAHECRARYHTIIAQIRAHKRVILADADAGPLTVQLLIDAGLVDQTTWLYSNAPHPRTYTFAPGGHAELTNTLIEEVKAGKKVAIHAMSKETGLSVYRLLSKALPIAKILFVSSDTIEAGVVALATINADITRDPPDVLIYTPVMGTGVSIDIKNHFDSVCLFASNHAADGPSALQGVMRIRSPKTTEVRVSGDASSPPAAELTTPEYWDRIAKAEDEANRKVIEALKIQGKAPSDYPGYTTDLNADEGAYQHYRLGIIHQAASHRNGHGSVTFWLCGNVVNEPRELHRTPEGKEISKALSEIREEIKDEEASAIAAVPPESLILVNLDSPKTPKAVKESAHKSRVYGEAWENTTEAERKELVLADKDDAVYMYAALSQWVAGPEGRLSVATRDLRDMEHTSPLRRRNRALFAIQASWILKELGVDLRNPSDLILSSETAAKVCKRLSGLKLGGLLHRDIALGKDWQKEPMRLVTSVLRKLGLNPASSNRRLPASEGGGRSREYTLKATEIERMKKLAAHQIKLLEDSEATSHSPGDFASKNASNDTALKFSTALSEMEALLDAA